MTEARPMLAIRIPRPWTTEEDYLANESETISRTGMLLLGTHSRPQGTILRFEVTLQTGAPMVRGEGRVVSYNEDAFDGQPGLLLKFTRLDPKSKAFVDRVAALRNGPPSLSTSSVAVASIASIAPGASGAPGSMRGYVVAGSQHPADANESTTISFSPPPMPPIRPMSSPPAFDAPATNAAPSYRPSSPAPMSASPSTIPPARPSAPPPLPGSSGASSVRRSVPPPLPAAARMSKRPSVPPPSEGSSTSISVLPPAMAPEHSRSQPPPAPPAPSIRPSQPPASQRSPSIPPPVPSQPAARLRSNPPPTMAAMAAGAVMSAATPAPPSVKVVSREAAPREASYSRTRAIQAPPNREDLLTRLRARAKDLPDETRARILAGKAPQAS